MSRRARTIGLLIAILAGVPSAARALEEPHSQVRIVRHTEVIFKRPLSLHRLKPALRDAGQPVVAFQHLGPTTGGFLPGGLGLVESIRAYKSSFSRHHGEGASPQVIRVVLDGEVASLGLEDLIVVKRLVPAPLTSTQGPDQHRGMGESLRPHEGVGPVASSSAKSQAQLGRGKHEEGLSWDPDRGRWLVDAPVSGSSAMSSLSKPASWMPDSGSIHGESLAPPMVDPNPDLLGPLFLDRHIQQTVRWDSQSSIDAFGPNDNYEHNLTLFNEEGSDSSRPACWPNENDDFWANREAIHWETTFPAASAPYFESATVLDKCKEMDLTTGLWNPGSLSPATDYTIDIYATSDPQVSESQFRQRAEKLPNDCPSDVENDYIYEFCVGLPGYGVGTEEYESLIPKAAGCVLPGTHSWTAGEPKGCHDLRASLSSSGVQGNSDSYNPVTSANGRFIAFGSSATNLVAGDTRRSARSWSAPRPSRSWWTRRNPRRPPRP